jgi:hypothetical protein
MTAFRHAIVPALIVIAVLMAMSSAAAQPPRTSGEIQAKVQQSVELQRQALQSLTDPGRAERLIDNAYAALDAAMSAMVTAATGRRTPPDPLLNLNEQKMRQALTHLQQASDTLKVNRRPAAAPQGQDGTPAAESQPYLDGVRKSVEQALRLTNSVLVF